MQFAAMRLLLHVVLLLCSGCRQPGREASIASLSSDNLRADLLVSAESCHAPSKIHITGSDARRDLSVLERILRGGYAGWSWSERRNRLNWPALLAGLQADVELARETVSVRLFRDRIAKRLLALQDCHFRVEATLSDRSRISSSACRVQYPLTADLRLMAVDGALRVSASAVPGVSVGEQLVACEQRPIEAFARPTLPPETYLLVKYDTRLDPPPMRCSMRSADGGLRAVSVPLRRMRGSGPRDVRAFGLELREGRVSYLRVGSFAPEHADALETFVRSPSLLRRSDSIVVDLRGNGGGVDRFAERWFREMSRPTLQYGTVRHLVSDVTRQGEVNATTCRLSAEGLDAASRDFLARQLVVRRRRLSRSASDAASEPRTWTVARPVWGASDVSYGGWLLLLVDENCVSACENFVTVAKQMPRVRLFGHSTRGTGVFADTVPYRLPNSGIWVHVATKLVQNPTTVPEFPEGRGYEPDIWLDEEDPVRLVAAVAASIGAARR